MVRLALVLALLPGCYQSHRRPGDASVDALRRDVLEPACPAGDACNPAWSIVGGVCAPPSRVLDDGFEDAMVSFGNPPGTVLSCWTVVAGDADIVSDEAGFVGPSDTGRNALDLNGWTSGTIERTVRVGTGRAYRLRFAYTRNPQMEGPTATGELRIDGRTIATLTASPLNTASDLMWSYWEGVLGVRAGDTMTISFVSTNPGNGGIYLDSITMDEVR
jgi:hypothetical protein